MKLYLQQNSRDDDMIDIWTEVPRRDGETVVDRLISTVHVDDLDDFRNHLLAGSRVVAELTLDEVISDT